ncbi:MAG: DUF2846 domain-containing protein [Mariprofundus sp.]|nr:DUF2846 domain-containing protein [Mariprofundus sp.]
MNKKVTLFAYIVVVLGLFALTGCGAKGMQFAEFKKPQEGKGLIYIYRPESFIGGGIYYDVHAQGKVLGTLRNGGYFSAYVEPGEVEFWAKTEAKSSVYIEVKSNQMYCIRGGISMGLMIGRAELNVTNALTCKNEILATQYSE